MPIAAVLAIDVVLTIAFAVIGRASHEHGLSASGIAQTAWPFLVGLAVGWLAARAITRGWPRSWRTAWPVWICTVAVGMLLRQLTGQGTAGAFVVVATLTLGVLLLGWRLVAARALTPSTSPGA